MAIGPKEWSPGRKPTDDVLGLVEEMQRLHPEYRDWVFEFMYPGSFVYHQKHGTLSVFFTPDWNRWGEIAFEVVTWHEGNPEVVDLPPAVGFRRDRSAERLFGLVKPILDEHSEAEPPPSMGAVPEGVRLERPWEATFPLADAVSNIFGRKAGARAYAKIRDRVGEEPVRWLGEGEKGVAYALPSGRVLKLTADEDELRAMALLKGAPDHPNLVRVRDAFVVREDGSATGVIVRDAVDEALGWSGRYPNLASHLRYSVLRANDLYIRRRNIVHPRQALWEAMLFLADEIEGEPARRLDAHERALIPGIRDAVTGLNERGIFTVDLTPNNIGLTDGRPVLFDLSMASVPEDVVEVV